MVKLMLLFSVLFFAWILVAGFLDSSGDAQTLVVELPPIAEGEAAYILPARRSIIIVHRRADPRLPLEQRYLVAYAQDSVYGCEVKLEDDSARLKAECADVEYGLDGRLIRGTGHHSDLKSPEYRWLGPGRLQLILD